MPPLSGYLDRISARPGEAIAVKVSSHLGEPYTADLVRIIHADPNPDGPGMKLEALGSAFAGPYPSRVQRVTPGSYAVVKAALAVPEGGAIRVRVQPGLLKAAQPVVSLGDAVLRVAAEGARLEVAGAIVCAVAAPMLERCWYELTATFKNGTAILVQVALQTSWGVADSGEASGATGLPKGGTLLVAADPAGGRFDGRIEDPALLGGDGNAIAEWDFSAGIDTDTISGTYPGRVVNMPTRGIRGSRWSGGEMDWKHAPREYAAIHFHADDLYDALWDTDFTITIPDGMRSGVYGVRLRVAGHEDIIPFYVLPPRGTVTAKIAFLAPTFTYQAYANHARFNFDAPFRERAAAWGARTVNPEDYPDLAWSTYNRHPDGTGISLSSLRRPVLTLRPGFLTFNDQRGSGLRHFSADSHLTDWLEATGHAFDVVTDHDLHREGASLLAGYKVVLTGSHPEYHTPNTLDGLGDYIAEGGRLCYLGGNGFYWRIAVSDTIPDVLEVRRTEGGIRAWDAAPGEAYHQLDGGYGGLWRRLSRAPQKLAGVGFSSQGLFEGSHYRRLPASYDPAVAWVFEGVKGETLGGYGLSGGGAAGFELDRADLRLGSPPNIVILARSEAHQDHFVAVPEELLSHVNTVTGEAPRDLIRAEIVYFDTAKGGAVFATGSITFCGSLSHDNYQNGVSRMMGNVVRRFTQ
ncbi:N,N-dimethylformamidase beta subunit family domain-containing protein [Acidisphaera sp. L21]|uniref:N,N-dimethylformamidase beta subunit family domain-containing protein n=1 Tax=Acidisphaera sp. L21 TaxID=1641851 RepID=UPI00131C16A8|nr:N,N-dimethylformamidase beta subunit family domain-containing protein [Acidisphaera sp. L21]